MDHLDSYKLNGKVALVTGGGQGIGESCAHALIESGAEVIIVGRDESKLISVTSELNKRGSAKYFVADLAKQSDIESIYNFVFSQHKN